VINTMAAVDTAVTEFDQLQMCGLARDLLTKIFLICRNSMRQQHVCSVSGGVFFKKKNSVSKAEEKRGDVSTLVATTRPSNHFHAMEIPAGLRI